MGIIKLQLSLLFVLTVATFVAGELGFYETLEISKDANARDIRRAFKQAALKYHPDKNNEPDAHSRFLRINRAYEVLKDDDLRRKYDLHGEAGLEDNGGRGGQYQSWNYYQQDFGLYDDDPEIVTLSASDFDLLVTSSNDTWFINFYSPGCPPCHRIAPTWREMAREIDGIVRVGAVNCQEDRQLCNEQGIGAFPSLLLFPRRTERYGGDRSRDALVQYVMENVRLSVARLDAGEFRASSGGPWLVHFCAASQDTDCLSDRTLLRLTGMLRNLMSVGHVDCDHHAALCKEHGAASGTTVYFPRKSDKAAAGDAVELPASLDAREIGAAAIAMLPKARLFTERSFQAVRGRVQAEPVLLLFGAAGRSVAEDAEVRKLAALLPDMEVGVVDCAALAAVCSEYHVSGEATMLLKPSGYELFYGKRQALDVAAFARESALSSVRALGPRDFPQPVTEGGAPFFVDFFAPWCPPCRRLLPQFRKAAAGIPAVKFGTVDCVVHGALCRSYNVHSYPTAILFNATVPHQYSGGHSSGEIVEFAQDVLAPSVVDLSPADFKRLVEQRDRTTTVLVDFYSPRCGPCIELAPTWNKLARMIKDDMVVAKVDCARHRDFCQGESLAGYPTMRAYPMGHTGKAHYRNYQGWRNLESIRNWALSFLPRTSEDLGALSFPRRVLQRSDRPFVVLFSAGQWCGPCQAFLPVFEQLARRMEGERYVIGFGVVDCDQSRPLCGEAQIRQYPVMRVYEGEERYAQSGAMLSSQNPDEIYNFLVQSTRSLRRKPKKAKIAQARAEL